MSFRPEPPYVHGTPQKTGVLLVNLGSPDEATPAATRRYLREFLSDPRVVEIPPAVWWPILHGIILRTRPAKSAAKYATIWTPQGSPLVTGTDRLAQGVASALTAAGKPWVVEFAMRYGNPSVASRLTRLREAGATRILILPLYPQYSAATTASIFDAVSQWSLKARWVPEFRFVHQYHDHPAYIQALERSVRSHWNREGRSPLLVMTFHGLPERSLKLGDPYHCECHKTARLLAQSLGLQDHEYRVTFQSRFGRAKWLEPYTEPTLRVLASSGLKRVDVICPGFAIDCLETLEEISQEAREAFLESGGESFHYIDCLNDSSDAVSAMVALIDQHAQGWPQAGMTLSPEESATLQCQAARAKKMGAPR
ncbi:MAG: hypothetical protein RI949_3230 [Pseudomonadota bacterium]|jgi:ferrochelatase